MKHLLTMLGRKDNDLRKRALQTRHDRKTQALQCEGRSPLGLITLDRPTLFERFEVGAWLGPKDRLRTFEGIYWRHVSLQIDAQCRNLGFSLVQGGYLSVDRNPAAHEDRRDFQCLIRHTGRMRSLRNYPIQVDLAANELVRIL